MTLSTELALLSQLSAILDAHPMPVRKRALWFLLDAHDAIPDVEHEAPTKPGGDLPPLALVAPVGDHRAELVSALTNLGYATALADSAANGAIRELGGAADLRELIKSAIGFAKALEPKGPGGKTKSRTLSGLKTRGPWAAETLEFLKSAKTTEEIKIRFGISNAGACRRLSTLREGGVALRLDDGRHVAKTAESMGGGR